MKKPVKLQINTTGAWRDVITFDADNDVQCGEVMHAGEILGRTGKASLRIAVIDSPQPRSPIVLMYWTEATAWKVTAPR